MARKQKPRGQERAVGAVGSRPLVAIVGRPNVGKSTLFNKLARRKIAIVEDRPGVTRDRHYADAFAYGRPYVLIDTGGFDPDSDDPMQSGITEQVKMALEEADLVICLFDGTVDPMQADREAVHLLRQADKPVIYAANKVDSESKSLLATAYYELGVENIYPVSALHGRGSGDLEQALADALPPMPKGEEAIETGDETPRIAIIGRPNAGKSSLVNRLTGQERQMVDDRPGTTVDSIDSLIEYEGHRLILTDTAGMRRKRSVSKRGVEAMSVYQSIRAMERSDVVVLMIDAHLGVGEQDAKILGLAVDRGCAVVIGLNKADLMKGDELEAVRVRTTEILAFAPWATIVTLSAQTGRGVKKLLRSVDDAIASHRKRVTTGELNRFFDEVLEHHPPPTQSKRTVRLYFITQAQIKPPTFVVVANEAKLVHFSYQRYVANQIRERFEFGSTPIRIYYRNKNRKDSERQA